MINYLEKLLKEVNIGVDYSGTDGTKTLDLSNMDKSKYAIVAIPYDRVKLTDDELKVYMFNAIVKIPLGNIISLYAKHFICLLDLDNPTSRFFKVDQDKLVIGEFYKIGGTN